MGVGRGSRDVEKAWITPSGLGWLWSVLHGVWVPDSAEQCHLLNIKNSTSCTLTNYGMEMSHKTA